MTTWTFGKQRNRWLKAMSGIAAAVLSSSVAYAAVDIANAPLVVNPAVEPNVMFLIDDSGSMFFEVTPEDYRRPGNDNRGPNYMFPRGNLIYNNSSDFPNAVPSFRFHDGSSANEKATAAFFRSKFNATYYDPAVQYKPWPGLKSDGTPMFSDAEPTAAPLHPVNVAKGSRNLKVDNKHTAAWVVCTTNAGSTCDQTGTSERTYFPAVYYRHIGPAVWGAANYQEVRIQSGSTYSGDGRTAETRKDCVDTSGNFPGHCTYDQEIQNFANWFTYYRSRLLAAQAGIGSAFVDQKANMRVGFGAINKGTTTVDGISNTGAIILGVRRFDDDFKRTFLNTLYTRSYTGGGTPLRKALDYAGRYYSSAASSGPWSSTPGTASTLAEVECRQSYSILMTDGYWSDGSSYEAVTPAAKANVDGTGGPTITGPYNPPYTYNAVSPFTDGYSNTLADVAMYYWKNDLRPDLENKVPVSRTAGADPAFWQHMVTFGVAFGVTGSISPESVTSGATVNWPSPGTGTSSPGKIDDLLHASVNSYGGFFSAKNPTEFSKALSSALTNLLGRAGSSTASAVSSAVLLTDSLSFAAGYNSEGWFGDLAAYRILAEGARGDQEWSAAKLLAERSPESRRIFTHNGTVGKPLVFGQLSGEQQLALNHNVLNTNDGKGTARIQWLKGFDVTGFRNHPVDEQGVVMRVGDIVGSNPLYVGQLNFGYGNSDSSYTTFRNSVSSREPVIYVGSNGGMLHAFSANNQVNGGGQELFAYVPGELLRREGTRSHAPLSRLMDPEYSHRYFVDGTPAVGDIKAGGSWKTILVGTLGAGGRSLFALDVTEPESFSESKVLWEFTDADMGYGMGQPSVVQLTSGDFAVVVSGGYNSATGSGHLFIINAATGALIRKIATGAGVDTGLSPAYVTDFPMSDRKARLAYAGDLKGNVWRFDISNLGAPVVTKIFTAVDDSGNQQPITARLAGAVSEKRPGQLLLTFGTGSYFRVGDTGDYRVQSLYGLYDSFIGTFPIPRTTLLEQSIVAQGTVSYGTYPNEENFDYRTVSKNPISGTQRGWMLDLVYSNNQEGERVINRAAFPSGVARDRVRFSTLIPGTDPCRPEVDGYIMDIDLFTGGATQTAVFDLNSDSLFDDNDKVQVSGQPEVVSGIKGYVGGEEIRTIKEDGKDSLVDGPLALDDGAQNLGRQSWEELR